jgi:hypothetical protein
LALIVGLVLAAVGGLQVLQPLARAGNSAVPPIAVDVVVTALIISAGTEGFNSIMKFLGYSKEKKAQEAGLKAKPDELPTANVAGGPAPLPFGTGQPATL